MTQTQITENTQNHIKLVYRTGAVAGLVVVLGSILDIIIAFSLGNELNEISLKAVDRFALFQVKPLLSLYYLDFLNLVTLIISIPSIFAIYWAMKKHRPALTFLGLVFFIIGVTLFISNNSALPMLQLSYKYSQTKDQLEQFFLSGMGDFLIAKGTYGSVGVFFGFFFVIVSELIISVAMLSKEVFSKWTGIIGVTGNFLMLIYIFIITFIPGIQSMAFILAMPGGLLLMAWMLMYSYKLLKL